jgi:hypothetical protein
LRDKEVEEKTDNAVYDEEMLKEFNKFYTPEYKKFIDEELTMEKQ